MGLKLVKTFVALLFSYATFSQVDTTFMINEIPFDFVKIKGGTYSPDTTIDTGRALNIKHSFWIGKYEITWQQWTAFMGWDDGRNQLNLPARRFTWYELRAFTDSLSKYAGMKVRMPTEAEWEYACVLGQGTKISNQPLDFMWVRENTGGVIQPVGTRLPDASGLHDMLGNVWEFTSDWYRPTDNDNSAESYSSGEKVRKGGSAIYKQSVSSCWYRYKNPPNKGNGNIGGRLVIAFHDKTIRG